jgi:hypothetical protein
MAEESVTGSANVVLNNTGNSTVKKGEECMCSASLKLDLKRAIFELESATEII